MKFIIYSINMLLVSTALSFVACNNDDEQFDIQPKDWDNTSNFYASTDEAGFATYYNPAIGRCGDPMPFYDAKTGEIRIYYLQEFDNNAPFCFHPIWAVATTDCANYKSMGEAIPTGISSLEPDAALGTGCCVYSETDNTYYFYYTGHNAQCENVEVVMRATSTDGITWSKDASWNIKGTDYGYSSVDFRDPQIFIADDGLYHMIVASTLKFAEFTSSNLKDWTHIGQFSCMIWDRMLECPDVFKMGDYWYMIYSEAYRSSWSRKVKYMMAKSLDELRDCFNNGPQWPNDGHEGVLDTRAFYAGKTASNGSDRYIWGWCPFRSGNSIDDKNVNVGAEGEPNWSGALVCHKIIQHADGTLTLGEVDNIKNKYANASENKLITSNGATISGNEYTLQGDNAYVLFSRLATHNHISFTVTTSNEWDKFGISLVRGTDSEKYYTMVVNPENENSRKVNFEQEGTQGKGFIEGIDGYWFNRPADNVYNINIYTDNSVMVMYINDVCCYTNRIYGIQKNCWSINNYGGNVKITDLHVTNY